MRLGRVRVYRSRVRCVMVDFFWGKGISCEDG